MTTLPRMVNKFTNLVDRINATFNEQNRNRFSEALKNVDILAQRLAEGAEPLKGLVLDTHETIKSIKEEFHKLSTSTQTALHSVEGAANDLGTYLKNNRVALDTLTQTGSYEILQTLGETREMVTKASRLFDKLDANPSSLIFDKQRKGISVPQPIRGKS